MKRRRRQKPKTPSATIEQRVDRALALSRQGKVDEAVAAYRQILKAAPRDLTARMNLGLDLARLGHRDEAVKHMQRAVAEHPRLVELRCDYARTLEELGLFEAAMTAYRDALAIAPARVDALVGLGRIQLDIGARDDAIATLEQATGTDALNAFAFWELFRALYDDRDPGRALDALSHAIAVEPHFVHARFHLGVLLDQLGQTPAAEELFASIHPDPNVYRGAVDSWRYAKAHKSDRTRFFMTTREVLVFAAQESQLDGLVLEMGVRYGITARTIASHIGERTLHGFDSFEGLPESWHIQPKGVYSTHGNIVELPDNVELHVGWFEDTIRPFAAAHPEPVRLMNVDCDLYSSTRTVLTALADRIVSGTVIVFDEYLINDRWRDDEFKAFQEAVGEHGFGYDYLAFSMQTGQAAVRIR